MKKFLCIITVVVMLFSIHTENVFANETVVAKKNTSPVLVDGVEQVFEAYTINNYNYFKLRDIAFILLSTNNQFDVTWDGKKNAINLTSQKAYSVVGSEMKVLGNKTSVNAIPSTSKIYLDDFEISLKAYTIDGYNYFKLRDLGVALGFSVDWDDVNSRIKITTSDVPYQTVVPKKTSLLPNNKDEDFALYSYVNPDDKTIFEFSFVSDQIIEKNLFFEFDLLIPKNVEESIKNKKGMLISRATVDVYQIDQTEIIKKADDFKNIPISLKNGKLIFTKSNGEQIIGKDCGLYYSFHIKEQMNYEVKNQQTAHKFVLRVDIFVEKDGYDGEIYIDNIILSNINKTIAKCDFNNRYGIKGQEGMQIHVGNNKNTDLKLWGRIDDIGKIISFNALRAEVESTGEAYEPNSSLYLGNIDKNELHNPEHDWRNWMGESIWWHDGYDLPNNLIGSTKIVIPKETFKGFINQDSYIDINVSFVLTSGGNEVSHNLLNEDFIITRLKVNSKGVVFCDSITRGEVLLTEYSDSWLVTLRGQLKNKISSTEHLSMQVKETLSGVNYRGYWYYTDFLIMDGDKEVENFKMNGNDFPDDFYNHGTNGSYYYWNHTGSYIYHHGLDNIENIIPTVLEVSN